MVVKNIILHHADSGEHVLHKPHQCSKVVSIIKIEINLIAIFIIDDEIVNIVTNCVIGQAD